MSQLVLDHEVDVFTTNVGLLVQQRTSKLRDLVMQGSHVGVQAAVIDQVGEVAATQRTDRYAPLTPSNVPVDRRWCQHAAYDWNTMLDTFDLKKLLIDPTSTYALAAGAAMGRAVDNVIVAAFWGTAKTGQEGGTSTSFLAGNQIAQTFGAGSTAVGLTVDKMKEALRILRTNEVDLDVEQPVMVVTAKQIDDLMKDIQVVNGDYNKAMVLQDGKLTQFLGIRIVPCQRLVTDGTYRRIPVFVRSAMHLGVWQDVKTNLTQRTDLSGQPMQIYTSMDMGATRTEEKKIVEIKCAE